MFTFVHLLRPFKNALKLKLKFSWKCYMEITHEIETLHYLMFA